MSPVRKASGPNGVQGFGLTPVFAAIVAAAVAAVGLIGVSTAVASADPAPAPCRSVDVTGCTPLPPPGYELPDPTGGMSAD